MRRREQEALATRHHPRRTREADLRTDVGTLTTALNEVVVAPTLDYAVTVALEALVQ